MVQKPHEGDAVSGKRKRLGVWLSIVFLAAMALGAGPGILVANQPLTWFGLPRLYVWGVFWCGVEVAVVLIAYFFVWQADDPDVSTSERE